MRLSLAAVVVLGASLAACGGDDGASVPDAEVADGPPAPDAEVPDAEPAPDAMVAADLTCADDPLPTTGADPIVITGHAQSGSTNGVADLQGAVAEAYRVGSLILEDTDTSDAAGVFTLTINNDALTPVDGYVKGTATTYLDSYLYPPFPLATNTDQAPLLFITNDTLNLLGFVSGASQNSSHGFLGLLVVDCAGNPVQGATVTISPVATAATTKIVYVGDNNLPDTALTSTGANGVAFVFNAPQGEVVVDASVGGDSLREHTITVRVGAGFPAVTSTAIAPGPITVTP